MYNVGTTHISHIEMGNCIPSLKVFIAILNALSCSANETLCDELNNAEHTYLSEIANIGKAIRINVSKPGTAMQKLLPLILICSFAYKK